MNNEKFWHLLVQVFETAFILHRHRSSTFSGLLTCIFAFHARLQQKFVLCPQMKYRGSTKDKCTCKLVLFTKLRPWVPFIKCIIDMNHPQLVLWLIKPPVYLSGNSIQPITIQIKKTDTCCATFLFFNLFGLTDLGKFKLNSRP